MALITSSSIHIFKGAIGNESSSMAGTLSATVNAHLETINTGSLVSINTDLFNPLNGTPPQLVVTVVSVSGSGHTYNIADRVL